MKTASLNEINIVREIFIENLSSEFISKTGAGAYAYLAPMDINQLFKIYLKQNKTIENYVRHCVEDYLYLQ